MVGGLTLRQWLIARATRFLVQLEARGNTRLCEWYRSRLVWTSCDGGWRKHFVRIFTDGDARASVRS